MQPWLTKGPYDEQVRRTLHHSDSDYFRLSARDNPMTTKAITTTNKVDRIAELTTTKRRSPVFFNQVDLDVVEELAAKRWPDNAIAFHIGCDPVTFRAWKKEHKHLEHALQKGRAVVSVNLAAEAEKQIRKGNPIITAFALKQPMERGGLEWTDERSVRHSGSIEHVVTPAQEAANARRKDEPINITAESKRVDV